MKNTLMLASVLFMLLVSTAVTKKEKATTGADNLDYYFYFEANIDDGNYNNKTRYVSSVIYYKGFETCSYDYNFRAKAEKAFTAYLEAEYSCKRIRVTTLNYNVNNKMKTKQQAQEKMNSYIAAEKDKGNQVIKTNFSYSCE